MFDNILFIAMFWFFAAVGAISVAENIVNWIVRRGKKSGDMYVVLTVKNQQDTVEGLLRSLVWQNLHRDNGGSIPQIVVIDLGSVDDTPNILKRIADDYKFVHITDREGYMSWIKKMVN